MNVGDVVCSLSPQVLNAIIVGEVAEVRLGFVLVVHDHKVVPQWWITSSTCEYLL